MKKSLLLLTALILALTLGITASVTQLPFLLSLTKWVEPIGTIWIGFLKMTMLQLIVSLLIISAGLEWNEKVSISQGTGEQFIYFQF